MQGPRALSAERLRRPATNPVYRFCVGDERNQQRTVIAKWAPVYPENNEGQTEFLHYRAFEKRYGRAGEWRCPVALEFLSAENVLLTEESAGVPLRRIMHSLQAGTDFGELRKKVEFCGEWLAAFHGSGRRTPGSLREALATFGGGAIRGCDVPPMRNGSLPGGMGNCTIGRVHRDFGPGNILVCADHVTVLDAACNQPLPQMLDLAEFLAYLILLPAISLRTRRFCRALSLAFLTAYRGCGLSLKPGDELLLWGLTKAKASRALDRYLQRLDRSPKVLRRAAQKLVEARIGTEAERIAFSGRHRGSEEVCGRNSNINYILEQVLAS